MMRVVVVGGGISGLAVAYALRGRAEVDLLERHELGGTIRTVREEGFLIEGGPDSFLTAKSAAVDLCRELGLGDELIPLLTRRLYVRHKGGLHQVPEGFFLTVPTRAWPVIRSRLLSWRGKLRIGMDLFLPPGKEEDESLGSFVRRRFGKEVLDRIAEPLMAGIHCAEADRLSLEATFPRFRELERKRRSLIRGLWGMSSNGDSPLVALRGGMSVLVRRLSQAIDARVFLDQTLSIQPRYRVTGREGTVRADAVVIATPAPVAADLLGAWPPLAEAIRTIPYASTATVSLGYREEDVPRVLDATGFIIPRSERGGVLACSWSSSKFEDRAPAGHALLRCFLLGEPDDPVSVAREELRRSLGIEAPPVVARTFRWPSANPIYEVGHAKKIERIEALLPPGLHLTGAGYRGVGIPNCIEDAFRVARRVVVGARSSR